MLELTKEEILQGIIKQVNDALDLIEQYGMHDGAHHKTWVIDQVVRILTLETYPMWVLEYCDGEDGPETYDWDEGIAP